MAVEKSYLGFNDTGMVNITNEVGSAMLDKMSRIRDERRLQPLDQIFDNVVYSHRALYDGYNLMIGDTYFVIPPEFIMVMNESQSESIVTLRQENSTKSKAGFHKKTILIDLVFNGINQINGYPVEGPEGTYYVDGLRQLLAQFKCTPILPITNELINGVYEIFTVALQSITISTVEGYPDAMTCQITLQEIEMFPYINLPNTVFKYMIDWDLFRFYYQRFLTEKHEYKKLQSLDANKEHNRFKISVLDEAVFISEEATSYNFLSIITDEKIVRNAEDGSETTTNYIEWVSSDESDVHISQFNCGYSNLLTNIQLNDSGSPTLQFLGGMDTIYNIVFETTDYEVVRNLEQCQMENDILVRNNAKVHGLGFVKLESELVEFTGSLFVMIESVSSNTVPGFPGLYSVQMQCVSYDIRQSEREELHGFKPFDCNKKGKCGTYSGKDGFVSDHVHDEQVIEQTMEGLHRKITQDNYAEWKLRSTMEVYPDLRLPKYSEVNKFIDKCVKFRKDNGLAELPYTEYPKAPSYFLHGLDPKNTIAYKYKSKGILDPDSIELAENDYDVFVDPDFYVFYPNSYLSFLQDDSSVYGDEPKQRKPYTKTEEVTVPADYAGVTQKRSYSENKSSSNKDTGSSNNASVEKFIKVAMSYVGHSYQWGAYGNQTDSKGRMFDCSGLVWFCLKQTGAIPANTPRLTTSGIMSSNLFKTVPWKDRRRGDLLLRMNHGDTNHVAISLGNKKIVHAANRKKGVITSKEYWSDKSGGVCRRLKAFDGDTSSSGIKKNSKAGTGSASYSSVKQIINQDIGVWKMPTEKELNDWIKEKAKNHKPPSPFIGHADIFIKAAKESGLDPRYIVAHAALESNWGTSHIARTKNNYFGIGAVDWNPMGGAYSFGSGLEAGIVEGAKWIAKWYYNKHDQKTLYEMRWKTKDHQYASDPKWDTKIATIMVGAPEGSGTYTGSSSATNENTLTKAEFDAICRTIAEETKGEPAKAQTAMAQLIYDRLTQPKKIFGGLSNILNGPNCGFHGQSTKEPTEALQKRVKAVFCDGKKMWKDYRIFYALTPEDSHMTYKAREKRFKRPKPESIGKHTYFGNKKKSRDIRYTIVDSDKNGNASENDYSYEEQISVEAKDIKEATAFGVPVFVETEAIMYDNNLLFWGKNGSKIATNELNSTENIFNTSFCDEIQYSGKGRLVRAFPAFLFCILDEDSKWYDGKKLWTNYYVHKAVVDIAVHSTNDMPTSTATLTVSNSYHNLDRVQGGLNSYSLAKDVEEGALNSTIIGKEFNKLWFKLTNSVLGFGPKLTDQLIKLHQVICDHAKIREDMRVHIRMGYGSDPLALAPVINGHVSDVVLGDQISMVITSDGHELIQDITSANEKSSNNGFLGLFGLGEDQESSNIIAGILAKRQSWISHICGYWFEASKYHIEHFGLYFNKTVMYMLGAVGTGIVKDGKAFAKKGKTVGSSIAANIPVISNITGTIGMGVGAVLGGIVGGVGGLLSDLKDGITDLWDGEQEQYDLLKNIYKANYKHQHYIYTSAIPELDGEQNVVFTDYNMTPWDVFQICTQQVPEYIIKPEMHQFDSRVYFGLPCWMEKYRYDTIGGKVFEECKTAAQVHFIDSMDSIIDDQVKVTSKFSNTNIKVMYTRGSSAVSTDVIHSDITIDASKQKTTIMDSPIMQDALGPDAIFELCGYNIGKRSARRVGISNLLYGWQQQYQGSLICMGSPGVKPHDYIMLNDTYVNLFGVCIVREVVHSFSSSTGFTTSITPGMVGFSADENSNMIPVVNNYLMLLSCFAKYTMNRKSIRNNYEKNLDVVAEVEAVRQKAINLWGWSKQVGPVTITPSWIDKGKTAVVLASDAMSIVQTVNIAKFIVSFANLEKLGRMATEFGNAFKTAWNAGKGIRKLLTGIKEGTIAAGAAAGGWPAVIAAAIWFTIDTLLDQLFEYLENRNVCVLLPLWWEGYPFVAGVKDGTKILLVDSNSTATSDGSSDRNATAEEIEGE